MNDEQIQMILLALRLILELVRELGQ
jgi:hypothetical protein